MAIFLGFSLCKDLSDNLAETPIVKNSSDIKISLYLHFSLSKIIDDIQFLIGDTNYIVYIDADLSWVIITTAMVGKFLVNIPGTGTWLYALEMYPTSIRSIGVHTCSFAARVGAVGASYIGILVSGNCDYLERFKTIFLMGIF